MLFIKIIEGSLTRETNLLLKMDPYYVVSLGKQEFKSSPHYGGGSKPKWNQTCSLEIKSNDPLRVEVWSRSIIAHDSLIGKTEIDLRRYLLLPGKAVQQYLELMFENKSAGKILMEIVLTSTAAKKKPIFQQKGDTRFRTSLPEFPEIMSTNSIDLNQLKQAHLRQNPHNRGMPPPQSKDQAIGVGNGLNHHARNHNPHQQGFGNHRQMHAFNHPLTNVNKNPTLQGKLANTMAKMNLNGNPQGFHQRTLQNNPQRTLGNVDHAANKNSIPGQPYNQAKQTQRPTSPHYNPNGTENAQGRHKPNSGLVGAPKSGTGSLVQEQKAPVSEVETVADSKESSTQGQRQNNILSREDRPARLGIGKTPPKSILTPGKDRKRSKSNKRVKFDI